MNLLQRIALLMAAAGVGIGAFGAHILAPIIQANSRTGIWETGMQYYWIHVLALLLFTFSCRSQPVLRWSASVWLVSICLFSGSLFALALGAPTWVGAITPLGGVGFIAGWLLLLKLKIHP